MRARTQLERRDVRYVRLFAELICSLLIADGQRGKSAPVVWNFARETRTDLQMYHARVCDGRSDHGGWVARGRDGGVVVWAVASRILVEGGSGEHDAAVREGIRVYSRE